LIKNIEKEGDIVGKLLDSEAIKKTCVECMDLFTKDENGAVISDFENDYTSATFNDINKKRDYFIKINKKLQEMQNTLQLKYYSTGNTAYIKLIEKLQNCYEQLFNVGTAQCQSYIKPGNPAKAVVNPY
jgi:hypothetical protein